MNRVLAAALVAALVPTAGLRAQAIIAQLSGLASPSQVIDFGANLFPNFTPVSTQFAGIALTHASYFTTGVSNNLVGGFLTNDFAVGLPNTLRIVFAQPISDLSFVYHQISTASPSTIRAVLQGVTVDSFSGTWNQSQPNNYFGFTNTVFDELQVDFVADFNVDTLAFNYASSATCTAYNGSGINPLACSCVTLPQLGTTWQGAIATTPNTLLTALFYGPGGASAPIPALGGEVLIQLAPSPIGFTSAGSYALPIPAAPVWVGTTLAFQGLRLELVAGSPTIELLNGLYLVIGS
ncbi:MAG: hypothetical protein WAT39_18095 [Planctomycetota bacterium]